jgi:hypothetical protein
MLRDCKSQSAYLETYGKMLGQRAVEALRPLYRAGIDKPLDLSFFSEDDPDRTLYASQESVVNALVASWQTREQKPNRRARKTSKILCGEMGTGKTPIGAATIHAAAVKLGLKGYRVCIMAPNHLIAKWEREIHWAVPDAEVWTFEKSDPNSFDDSYREAAQYINDRRRPNGRWAKPTHPEFVIVGRNQAKQDADWEGLGERKFAYEPGVCASRIVGEVDVTDAGGKPVLKADGTPKKRTIREKVPVCPKCGQRARNGKSPAPWSVLWDKQLTCPSTYFQEIGTEDRRDGGGLDVISPIPPDFGDLEPGRTGTLNGRTYEVRVCGEPLWQFVPKPRKWAPAKLFHKQGRKMFHFFILDEMHEEKAAESGQAIAAGKLIRSARRRIGLTGTLIGGYAHHLFPLLMRLAPSSLIEEGFTWGGVDAFTAAYGRIDTTFVTKMGSTTRSVGRRGRGQTSMRKNYDGDTTTHKDVKPGVMPTFFGRHLIDKAVFISLDEMEDDLPELIDDDRSLIAVDMDPVLAAEYKRIEKALVEANTELLIKGSTKLLGAMLHTLLEYPDRPYGWVGPFEDRAAIGYFTDPKYRDADHFVGVVQPADLPEDVVYAKEQALYDLIHREKTEGRQVWTYCTQTGKRDVQGRLAGILKLGGIESKVLRSSQVETYDREAWIAENGPGLDVILSHPELVSTGLDFFDKEGTFNFATIAFYEGDYRVNLMRQAGRRHWRIGQPRECRTYYLYYKGTMQERQVLHVGEKYAAAQSLEGKFSAEGLAAMSSGGLAMTAMAKSLTAKIDDPRESWAKLRSQTKKKLKQMHGLGALDTLADAVAFEGIPPHLAETIILSDADLALLDEVDPDGVEVEIDDDLLALLDEYDPELVEVLDRMHVSLDSLTPS